MTRAATFWPEPLFRPALAAPPSGGRRRSRTPYIRVVWRRNLLRPTTTGRAQLSRDRRRRQGPNQHFQQTTSSMRRTSQAQPAVVPPLETIIYAEVLSGDSSFPSARTTSRFWDPADGDPVIRRHRHKTAPTPEGRSGGLRRAVSRVPFTRGPSEAIISLGPSSPTASSTLPAPPRITDPARRPVGLLALARGGVCRAPTVTGTGGALLPHRFTLACDRGRIGGLFSVALSLTRSPRAGGGYPPPSSCRARTFLVNPIGSTRSPARRSQWYPLASAGAVGFGDS